MVFSQNRKFRLKNFKNVICFPKKVLFKRNLFLKSKFFQFFSNNLRNRKFFLKTLTFSFLKRNRENAENCAFFVMKFQFFCVFISKKSIEVLKTKMCEANKNIRGLNFFFFLKNCFFYLWMLFQNKTIFFKNLQFFLSFKWKIFEFFVQNLNEFLECLKQEHIKKFFWNFFCSKFFRKIKNKKEKIFLKPLSWNLTLALQDYRKFYDISSSNCIISINCCFFCASSRCTCCFCYTKWMVRKQRSCFFWIKFMASFSFCSRYF